MKPSNFKEQPYDSVLQKSECETIARNIMVILHRTGNEWRELDWEEYMAERKKDGGFSHSEREYFDRVIPYCKSAELAKSFSPKWAN